MACRHSFELTFQWIDSVRGHLQTLDITLEPIHIKCFLKSFLPFPLALTLLQALWAVQEWNKKWLLLQRRKSELQAGFKERVPVDTGSTPETDKLVKNIFRFTEDAESEQVLDDFEAQFNLHFPRDESEILDFRFKRPRFRSLYSIGHQAGLGTITKHFGLASEALGENLKAGYKVNIVVLL